MRAGPIDYTLANPTHRHLQIVYDTRGVPHSSRTLRLAFRLSHAVFCSTPFSNIHRLLPPPLPMGSSHRSDGLPYWQVNVAPGQRSPACPDFLRNLSPKDERIIGTPQADYAPLSWPAVRAIVAANELGSFQRDPLALRRYLAYAWGLKQQYGSAVNFVLQERLHWTVEEVEAAATTRAGADFSRTSDFKILCNDWPYGLDDRIVHLVVWTKFPLPEDPATGDLTDSARAAIEAFVQQTFGVLPKENVGAVPYSFPTALSFAWSAY